MQTWFAVSKHLLGLEGRGRIFFLICFFLIKLYDYKCKFKNMAPSQRFKKILNQMGKTHHHFFLHCLVKRRNEYITRLYEAGRRPLLSIDGKGLDDESDL